jgi:hypothetical protein
MNWPAHDLPYGLNGNYVLPRTFLRSALFSSMRYRGRKRPRVMAKTEIDSYEKLKVYQLNGEQLDGNDLDVLAGCVRCVYETTDLKEAAVSVHFEEKAFLKQVGWQTGGVQRRALAQCLERMRSSGFAFEIVGRDEGQETTKNTSLIFEYTRHTVKNRAAYTVTLNRMIAMQMHRGFSVVNRMQRNLLRENPEAQWLHAFYSTHRASAEKPLSLPAEKLRPLMKRKKMRDDKWRKVLQDGLVALQSATKWECWLLEDGMVQVAKPKRAAEPQAEATPTTTAVQPWGDDDDI